MCRYCEPWYASKPIVETRRVRVGLVVKDDMYRYVQVLIRPFKSWHEFELEPIGKCPMCGGDV